MKIFLALLLLLNTALVHARLNLDDLREAARSNNLPQLARLADKSQGDVLEMYPQYYLLIAQLSTLDETQAQSFMQRYADSPLANKFRSQWLSELARRENWPAFQALYPKIEKPSLEMQCWNASAAFAQGKRDALLALRPYWFSGNARPQACKTVFDTLFTLKQLTQEDIWARIRLALAANNLSLTADIAEQAGIGKDFPEKLLLQLRNTPEKAWPHSASSRAARERALYALSRMARSDVNRAAAQFSKEEKDWPLADRQYGWEIIAAQSAFNLEPRALNWFNKANLQKLSVDARIWLIRSALRANDWKTVETHIALLPDSEQQETSWQYWKARALQQAGKSQEAVNLFVSLSGSDDFYGLLAREDLGSIIEPPVVQYRASEDEIYAVQNMPGMQRALLLIDSDWRTEAINEWNEATRNLNDQLLIAAAELARRKQWNDRAINAASRTRQLHNFSLRYLAPFRGTLDKAAKKEGLDPAWVYGLVRQESRFIPEVRSSAGAMGLMQVMPSTAKWIASKKGIKRFDSADALEVSTNVEFGTYYLRLAWEKLDYSQVLASAGYNAGPGRARKWQADTPLEAAIYIESIPFSETRDYVKKVMTNTMHYAHILGSEQSTLKARIGTIPARENSTPDLP